MRGLVVGVLLLVLFVEPLDCLDAYAELQAKAPEYTTFLSLVNTASLLNDILQSAAAVGNKPTLFIPTNAAFTALPAGTLAGITADVPTLVKILQFHLVPYAMTEWTAANIQLQPSAPTMNVWDTLLAATQLDYQIIGGAVTLRPGVADGDVLIVTADMTSDNRIMHSIDKMLYPPGVQITPVPPPTTAVPTLVPPMSAMSTVADNLKTIAGLTRLGEILANPALSGLTNDQLGGGGPLTFFAATDTAWGLVPQGVKEFLNDNPASMQAVLSYHTIMGNALSAAALPPASPLITSQGTELIAGLLGAETYLTAKGVVGQQVKLAASYPCSNGELHLVDVALLPADMGLPKLTIVESLAAVAEVSLFAELLRLGGMETYLNDKIASNSDEVFTVFAPTNAAWEAMPAGQFMALKSDLDTLAKLLQYHITASYRTRADLSAAAGTFNTLYTTEVLVYTIATSGELIVRAPGQVDRDGAAITLADVKAVDGVVHVIDKILIPQQIILPQPSLWSVMQVTTELSYFVDLVKRSEKEAMFEMGGPLTVLLPSNVGFANLPSGMRGLLLSDVSVRDTLINYAVSDGKVLSQDLVASSPLKTVLGEDIFLTAILTSASGTEVIVNAAGTSNLTQALGTDHFLKRTIKISTFDVPASNGVMHLTDYVAFPAAKLPQTVLDMRDPIAVISSREPLRKFASAVASASNIQRYMKESPGPFTFFSPSDAAIDKLGTIWDKILADPVQKERVLRSHIIRGYMSARDLTNASPGSLTSADDGTVLTVSREAVALQGGGTAVAFNVGQGGVVSLNDGQGAVTDADIAATNGVMHVVDGVLLPPDLAATVLSNTTSSLYDIIAVTSMLDSVRTAVNIGVLTNTLQAEGPYVLFAPSDSAFAKLPIGEQMYILTRADVAANMMKSHIVQSGVVKSVNLPAASPLQSLQGSTIQAASVLSSTQGSGTSSIVLNTHSTITQEDVQARNGVIHIISDVLIDRRSGWGQTLRMHSTPSPFSTPIKLPYPFPHTTTTAPNLLDVVLASTPNTSKFLNIVNSCGIPCTTLLKAVTAAGLTVFAPVDSGINMWSDGSYDRALSDATFAQSIVRGHIVDGYIVPATLRSALTPGSLEQSYLTRTDTTYIILRSNGDVMELATPEATLITRDAAASNGVLHAISLPLTGSIVATPMPSLAIETSDDSDIFTQWWVLLIIVLGGICLIVVILLIVFFVLRKKKQNAKSKDAPEDEPEKQAENKNTAPPPPPPAPYTQHVYKGTEANPLQTYFPTPMKEREFDCISSEEGSAVNMVSTYHVDEPAGYMQSYRAPSGARTKKSVELDFKTEDDLPSMKRAYGSGPPSKLPAANATEAHSMRQSVKGDADGALE